MARVVAVAIALFSFCTINTSFGLVDITQSQLAGAAPSSFSTAAATGHVCGPCTFCADETSPIEFLPFDLSSVGRVDLNDSYTFDHRAYQYYLNACGDLDELAHDEEAFPKGFKIKTNLSSSAAVYCTGDANDCGSIAEASTLQWSVVSENIAMHKYSAPKCAKDPQTAWTINATETWNTLFIYNCNADEDAISISEVHNGTYCFDPHGLDLPRSVCDFCGGESENFDYCHRCLMFNLRPQDCGRPAPTPPPPPPPTPPPSENDDDGGEGHHHHDSPGKTAGIIIGFIAGIGLVVTGVVLTVRTVRKKRRARKRASLESGISLPVSNTPLLAADSTSTGYSQL